MSAQSSIVWQHSQITRDQREAQNNHRAAVVWLTGLSGAGKTSIAHALEAELFRHGKHAFVLDGDNVRHRLCSDLGFSIEDRQENMRRITEVAKLLVEAGTIVIAAFISPLRADRARIRSCFADGDFMEIHCSCPLEICEQRDAKGLYVRARAGHIDCFTGISSPYEPPRDAELALDTSRKTIEECVRAIERVLRDKKVIG